MKKPYIIQPGSCAEFSLNRKDLQALLDTLPPEIQEVLFRMDSDGVVRTASPDLWFAKDHLN